MDFVLVDDSVINAYTERVSRIVKGFGQLQEKMDNIFSNVFGDEHVAFEQSTATETMDYSEPAPDMGYEDNVGYEYQPSEPMYEDNVGYEYQPSEPMYEDNVGYEYQPSEPMQSTETMESVTNNTFDQSFDQSFDEPIQETSQSDDLDIDLDAMLEGISFDEDELRL